MDKKLFYNISPPTSKNWELLFLNYQIIFSLRRKKQFYWHIYWFFLLIQLSHTSLCLVIIFIKPGLKCSYPLFLSDRTYQIFVLEVSLFFTPFIAQRNWGDFTLVSNRQLSGVDQMDTVYTTHYDKSFLLVRDRKLLRLP